MKKNKRINVDLMKDYNKRLVLRTIQGEGPISRIDIANSINLSRPSVSEIATQLINEGWIQELSPKVKNRGRTPRPLEINPFSKMIIGVEIGAYTTKIILCDLNAKILESQNIEVNISENPYNHLKNIAENINEIIENNSNETKEIIGVGIGMHGLVDSDLGISLYAPNLGWKDVKIKEILKKWIDLPIEIDNDCNSSALAEMWFGRGKKENNFISVLIDYGVGASIINNGNVFKGGHNVAGQIGHVTIDPDGTKCTCGNYGCLETFTSEPAILKKLKKRIKLGEQSVLKYENVDTITIDDFYRAVNDGDSLAVSIADEVGRYLGLGFSMLINLFGPKFIVLGGGTTKISNELIPVIKDVIKLKVLGQEAKKTPIFSSVLGENIYTIGAASVFIENELSLPDTSI